MNQRVMDAYIKKSSKVKGRLLKLGFKTLDLLLDVDESDDAILQKLDNLTEEIENSTESLQKKFVKVREEIEKIEQTRELTAQEEQRYIDQISDIVKDGEQKTKKVEELFDQVAKDIENN